MALKNDSFRKRAEEYARRPIEDRRAIVRDSIILAGPCGWGGYECPNPRIGGNWKDGGSYMCSAHFLEILPIRAVFDNVSPPAVAARDELHLEGAEAQLKREQKEEEREYVATD